MQCGRFPREPDKIATGPESIDAVDVRGPESGSPSEPTTFEGAIKTGARVLAVRPSFDQPYKSASVDAVVPAYPFGSRYSASASAM